MFYFESLKFKNSDLNYEYGLSLRLDKGVHYLTSTYFTVLNNVYKYIRNSEGDLDGNLFIDNINLSQLDNVNRINFCYENISFCENTIVLDQNLQNQKILDMFYSFDKKDIPYNQSQMLEMFGLDPDILLSKFKWMNEFNQWKFKLLLACIKPSKYLIIEPYNYQNFRENVVDEMRSILELIHDRLKKTVLIFQQYNNLMASEIIDLNSKDNYIKNKRLTLSSFKTKFNGFNLLANNLNIYKYVLKSIWLWWTILGFGSLILTTVFIFMVTIYSLTSGTAPEHEWLVNYAHRHYRSWLFGTWFIYLLNYILFSFTAFFVYKRTKNYLIFLNSLSIRQNLINLIIPLIIIFLLILITIIGFLINIFVFELKLNIHENDTWWASFYACVAYFLYAFITFCVTIFTGNKKTNIKLLFKKFFHTHMN